MGSAAPTEGLLYVTSCIRSPPLVSMEIYNKWYDEVHIPDLIGAKNGPVVALRYQNTSPKADVTGGEANADVAWPFLAIYKMNDIHWLTSDDFLAVSHDHAMLPAEAGHNAWGCFDAQLRSYKLASKSDLQPGTDRPKYIVTFETPVADPEKLRLMTEAYAAIPGYRGSIQYVIVPGLLEHEQKGFENKGYVISWFDGSPVLDQAKHNAVIWELVQAAGEKNEVF